MSYYVQDKTAEFNKRIDDAFTDNFIGFAIMTYMFVAVVKLIVIMIA